MHNGKHYLLQPCTAYLFIFGRDICRITFFFRFFRWAYISVVAAKRFTKKRWYSEAVSSDNWNRYGNFFDFGILCWVGSINFVSKYIFWDNSYVFREFRRLITIGEAEVNNYEKYLKRIGNLEIEKPRATNVSLATTTITGKVFVH